MCALHIGCVDGIGDPVSIVCVVCVFCGCRVGDMGALCALCVVGVVWIVWVLCFLYVCHGVCVCEKVYLQCPRCPAYVLWNCCTFSVCDFGPLCICFMSMGYAPWCCLWASGFVPLPNAGSLHASMSVPCESLWIHLEGGDYCLQTENSH